MQRVGNAKYLFKRHGDGNNIYFHGNKKKYLSYDGSWRMDKCQGKGVLVYTNGKMFIGNFNQNKICGHGILYEDQGGDEILYNGYWKDNLKHGECIQEHNPIDNTTFQGTFVLGLKEGYGTLSYADGSSYKGQWKQNKMHGAGELEIYFGKKYKGQFKDNMMHGKGVFEWPDGKRYEGQY